MRLNRNLSPLVLGTAIAVLASVPAYADLGDQLFKLLANDGATGDQFGFSIGISDTTAIVGAPTADPGGSAYLFDITTGQQLFKLTANNTQQFDAFGRGVGISGTIAIAGDPHQDSKGITSGAANLFDTTTGQQLFKLTANDAQQFDGFGQGVRISGTIAIAGAPTRIATLSTPAPPTSLTPTAVSSCSSSLPAKT